MWHNNMSQKTNIHVLHVASTPQSSELNTNSDYPKPSEVNSFYCFNLTVNKSTCLHRHELAILKMDLQLSLSTSLDL